MIERYTLPEMGRIWTDEHRFQKWLEVEIAVLEVRAARGQVPIEAVTRIRDSAKFSVERIGEIEAQTHHDVIAFVTNVSEFLGDDGRYFHQGLTSSDVVDTAFSLLIKDAIDIVIQRTRDLATRVRDLAIQNKDVVMIGRTHGVHAEPTTFGLKLAIWYRELRRSLDRLRFARTQIGVGKISGAVGTYTIITPDMEQEILPTPI